MRFEWSVAWPDSRSLSISDWNQNCTSFLADHRMTPSHTARAAALVGNARRTTGTKP